MCLYLLHAEVSEMAQVSAVCGIGLLNVVLCNAVLCCVALCCVVPYRVVVGCVGLH